MGTHEEIFLEAASVRSVKLAALVSDVATRLTAAIASRHDAVVTEALGRIGAVVGADRAYLMAFDWQKGTSSNTHEWCAADIEPQLELLQDVPNSVLPWFMERLKTGVVELPDISALPPEATNERQLLEPQGIQSLLILPVLSSEGLSGFVGFDSVRHKRRWSPTDVHLLHVLATVLGGVVERHRGHVQLTENRRSIAAILTAIPDLVFSLDRAGRIRYSKQMPARELLLPPELGEGRLLHEVMPAPMAERLLATVRLALDTGELQTFSYDLELPHGTQRFEARFVAQDAEHVVVIVRNVTEQVAAQRLVEEQRERLRVLAEQQVAAEQALRRRVAAEVHDGIAQELAMARMLLARAVAEPAVSGQTIRLASEVLDGAVVRIDELTTEISPPALRELGLPAALQEAGARVVAGHRLELELALHGGWSRPGLDTEALLYWSARELLINAVKHADARHLRVELVANERRWSVVIEDDGVGFELGEERPARGFGLFNTRERLRLAGGELSVGRRASGGCRAVVSLPRVGGVA